MSTPILDTRALMWRNVENQPYSNFELAEEQIFHNLCKGQGYFMVLVEHGVDPYFDAMEYLNNYKRIRNMKKHQLNLHHFMPDHPDRNAQYHAALCHAG